MIYDFVMGAMAFAGAVYTLAILVGFFITAKGLEGTLIKASLLSMIVFIPVGIAVRRVGNDTTEAIIEILSGIIALTMFHGISLFLLKVYKSQKAREHEGVQPFAGGDAAR